MLHYLPTLFHYIVHKSKAGKEDDHHDQWGGDDKAF